MRPAIQHVKAKFPSDDLVGVEVGVWKGDHAQEILDSLPNCRMLYLVDPWCDYPVYSAWNHEKYGDEKWEKWKKFDWAALHFEVIQRFINELRACTIRGLSHVVAETFGDEAVDFVYVDGSHEYTTVLADLKAWWPKIKSGGVLCGHDYWEKQPDVMRAVDEFVKSPGSELVVVIRDKDWWINKP